MNKILFLISLLGSIATSSGQGMGIPSGGGEVIWTDNIEIDDLDSTVISLSGDSSLPLHPDPDYLEGAAGAHGGSSTEKSGSQGHAEGTETTKLLRLTKPMTIQCQITMEQKPVAQMTLKWFKDDKELQESDKYKVFQENSTLIISATTVEDVGVYRCETVDFDPAQSYEMNIIYLKVKSLPKSITVLEGGKLTIPCEVEGTPMPNVAWYKGNMSVDDAVNSTRFDLGDNNMTYEVEKAVYDDRDNYTCAISSGDIHFNTTTFVRVKDMYAALWPFLGICTEVFILCLIIFVYEKRRAKNDYEESDTDQPPEQKNTSDLNKDNVRQRK